MSPGKLSGRASQEAALKLEAQVRLVDQLWSALGFCGFKVEPPTGSIEIT